MSDPLPTVEIEIALGAAACFQLLCDAQRVPDWVAGVANVTVIEADAKGRALLAEYTGMPRRASVSYKVRARYDDATLTAAWQTEPNAPRLFTGHAIVTPLGPDRCRLQYGLRSTGGGDLPSWAESELQEEPAAVAEAFRRWAERQS